VRTFKNPSFLTERFFFIFRKKSIPHTLGNMATSKNILISMVGMSPAVLTETIWALAQESDPWIPEQVVAITTTEGAAKIQALLLQSGEWERLRKKIGASDTQLRFGASGSIQILNDGSHDFSDITTPSENDAAADVILKILRQYTENPETQIVASIAGGRKTMSALMFACMTLLGREEDRICHVLANDQYIFDHKNFLFPKNKTEEKAAQIQLSALPFVRVRGLYEKELGKAPSSYSSLVHEFQSGTPPAINYPKIKIFTTDGKIFADGEDLNLSPREFLLVLVLCTQFHKKKTFFLKWEEVKEEIVEEMKKEHPLAAIWHEKMLDIDYRKSKWHKIASDIRTRRLKGKKWASALIPSPGSSLLFPPSKIVIRTSSDIRKKPKSKK